MGKWPVFWEVAWLAVCVQLTSFSINPLAAVSDLYRIYWWGQVGRYFFSCCFRPQSQALVYIRFILNRHSMEVAYPLSEALLGKISFKMALGDTYFLSWQNSSCKLYRKISMQHHFSSGSALRSPTCGSPGFSSRSTVYFPHETLCRSHWPPALWALGEGEEPHLLLWGEGRETPWGEKLHGEAVLSKISLYKSTLSYYSYCIFLMKFSLWTCPRSLS